MTMGLIRSSNQIESVDDLPIIKAVINEDGTSQDLDIVKLRLIIDEACSGVEDVSADAVFELIDKNIYDGIKKENIILINKTFANTKENISELVRMLKNKSIE